MPVAMSLKPLGRRVLTPFLGRRRLQGVFQAVVEIGYAGLNIGEGNHPSVSGERGVVEKVVRSRGGGGSHVLFDVGANVGDYTQMLLDVFGSTARIWAFEPAEATFAKLALRFRSHPCIELRRLALSDEVGTGVLLSPGEGSKLGSLHDTSSRLQRLATPAILEETVELVTLDSFCLTEGIAHIDYLKLDVEGHELSILNGAQRMIAEQRIGGIQFEFGGANIDSRTYFRDYFDKLAGDYDLYRVLRDGLCPIRSYRETLEVFKRATNYLALPRSN